ncbi:MAG: PhzF family phenazine biosynthesis protein [Candidatus Thiodiazotropha sp. (ex Dulcina madagascariensis)]|nr:PhzF family phenazine biosynthesis protein [Candidatus Thiodiazotropha sp. (ex Dulcina madagascariensis)]
MKHAIYVVDAFTDCPYGGNPAAVCLLDQEAESDWMQSIAAEMNLSDSAFLLPGNPGEWSLRWFTPKVEVDLCGHATLASAHVLWRELGVEGKQLLFHTRSGQLAATREAEVIALDFPTDNLASIPISERLIESLGIEPETAYKGREDILVALKHADELRCLKPDLARMMSLKCRGVIVTAPSDRPAYDFISRFFGPRIGIPEDPVTGSAHCSLAPFWAERLGKATMRGFQASSRGGVVNVQHLGERVKLLGQAVTTLSGKLHA